MAQYMESCNFIKGSHNQLLFNKLRRPSLIRYIVILISMFCAVNIFANSQMAHDNNHQHFTDNSYKKLINSNVSDSFNNYIEEPIDNHVDVVGDLIAYLDQESLESSQKKKTKKDEKSKKQTKVKKSDDAEKVDIPEEAEVTEVDYSREDSAADEVVSGEIDKEIAAEEDEFNQQDPYQQFNREMYYVNKQIDRFLIKPPSELYSDIMPAPVKHMVTNFFENLQDLNVIINDFLQLDVENSVDNIYRVALNSTFGVFGLIDVATDSGFPKKANDFGVTFGKWGATESPYFVIPILGPSTIRDTIGTGVGTLLSLNYYLPDDFVWPLAGVRVIDKRANLLSVEKIIDTVSDDEYLFVRNAYLSYRKSLILGDKPDIEKEQQEQELLDDILSDDAGGSEKLEDLEDLEDLGDLKELDNLE